LFSFCHSDKTAVWKADNSFAIDGNRLRELGAVPMWDLKGPNEDAN
jgi:hypothetical protein